MVYIINKSNRVKKGCTDSLSEEVIDGLTKSVHVIGERKDMIQKRMALEWGLQSTVNAILNVCYHLEEYEGIRSE